MKTIDLAILSRDSTLLEVFQRSLRNVLEAQRVSPCIHVFENGGLLKKSVGDHGRFDLVFLDMAEKGCLDLAGYLRDLLPSPPTVLLYGQENDLRRMLRLQPFRLIRREHLGEELGECLGSVLWELPNSIHRPWMILQSGGGLFRIAVDHIRYLESYQKQLHIVTDRGTLDLVYQLSAAEKMLDGYGFLRTHKSFLVNAACISQVGSDTVTLDDGTKLPMSRYRRQSVRDRIRELYRWDTV